MTKKEIIEMYLDDLKNFVPNSNAKKRRMIDLECELEALRIHDVVESVCDNCKPRSGFFPGVTCPKCGKPFRHIKQNV